MRKTTRLVAAAVLTAAVLTALAVVPLLAAQSQFPRDSGLLRYRLGSQDDLLTLRGAGSTIGVTARDMNSDEIAKTRDPQSVGVVVESVRDSSPASTAGLKAGDVIVEFDGERVRGLRQFTRLVSETPPTRTVKVQVVRDGARRTLDVTPQVGRVSQLDSLPALRAEVERGLRDLPFNFELRGPGLNIFVPQAGRLGVTLPPLSSQLGDYFGVKEGALVNEVVADSAAARAGLKAGDVITQVNGRAVRDPATVADAINQVTPGSTVDLSVVRDRKPLQLKATMPERTRERTIDGRRPV